MLIWIDTETTGLSPREGHLLEVAAVLTDDDLNEVCSMSCVFKPVGIDIDDVVMDDIVMDMHTKNGLFDEVRATQMRRHEAEARLIDFARTFDQTVETGKCTGCGKKREHHSASFPGSAQFLLCADGKHYGEKTVSLLSQTPVAGSTIGFDRVWLKEHMPRFEALFSYRSVDVSSFTEMAKRWSPGVYESRTKADKPAHRALADVKESIAILKHYRDAGFVRAGSCTVSRVITGREVITPPGAALEVTRLDLSPEAKAQLSTGIAALPRTRE